MSRCIKETDASKCSLMLQLQSLLSVKMSLDCLVVQGVVDVAAQTRSFLLHDSLAAESFPRKVPRSGKTAYLK